MQISVEIGKMVLEKEIFKFCRCIFGIFLFIYLPVEKDVALHLNKLESTSPTTLI